MEQANMPGGDAGRTAEKTVKDKKTRDRMRLTPQRLLTGMGASVGVGIAVGKLTGGPLKAQTRAFDGWLLDATRAVQSPLADSAMSVLSAFGEPAALYPLSGLAAAAWLVRHRQKDSTALALAIVGSAVIDKAVKSVVKRPRPFLKLPLPRSRPSGSSFPSNHATMSIATYGTIALLASAKRRKRSGKGVTPAPGIDLAHRKRARWQRIFAPALAMLLCALVGWSRVYRGVHNPSDVLGGWLVGAIWLAACTSWSRAATDG